MSAERSTIDGERFDVVEVEPVDDAEPRAEWRRQKAGPGRGADESELRQLDLDVRAAGPWPMMMSRWKSSIAE